MGAPSTLRLFFALWPDAPAREALRSIAATVAAQRGGRAPRDENLHVTVVFVGNVAGERLHEVQGAGEETARSSRSFTLTLGRLGGAATGIAWLAPIAIPDALATLHGTLIARLAGIGFETERRRYRPHVTLARHCALPARRSDIPPVTWRVDRLSLVTSTPAAGGSRYAETAAWPLPAGEAVSARA